MYRKAIVEYEYTVDGTKYHSDRPSLAISPRKGGEREKLNRYKVGKKYTAYYNPKSPAEAVLSREWPGVMWVLIVFFVIFFSIGLFFMFLRKIRRWQASRLRGG